MKEYKKGDVTGASKERSEDDEDIVNEMLEFFRKAEEQEAQNRQDMLEDLRFLYGEQWDDMILQDRVRKNRPCLTVNQLPQFIRQVTNDQRRNRPSIVISPVDSGADVKLAEVLTGLMRHIQVKSNASEAIDTAFFSAVGCGIGYMRVGTEYCGHDTFDQEIEIKKIVNPFSVYYGNVVDYEDSLKCILTEDIPKEEYEMLYPDFPVSGADIISGVGDTRLNGWNSDDTVRVAEFYKKCFRDDKLILLNNGMTILKSELDEFGELPEGIVEVSSRNTKTPYIEWYKSNGYDILDKGEIPGIYIPIIPVIGEEYYIDGERHLKGMVRDAKDSQRMYNVWASAQTEMIALAPKAPWLLAEGQNEDYEQMWESANIENYPALIYKPKTIGNDLAPPPQRMQSEPPVQAITQARMQSAQDLKAVTGMYDASIGQVSNERSGKAIRERKESGDNVNYHFSDNLARSIRYMGKVILGMTPTVYDTARIVRIIGEDGSEELVNLELPKNIGRYDVVVNVGPSYTTQRQESVESMMSLMNSAPQVMSVAADLMVRNMDWPGAKQIADRLKKAIDPKLLGEEGKEGEIPPQVQAQMAEMEQHLQALNAHAEQVELQMQQTEAKALKIAEENERLKTQLTDKSDELALKNKEIEVKKQIENRKLDIEEANTLVKAHSSAKSKDSGLQMM